MKSLERIIDALSWGLIVFSACYWIGYFVVMVLFSPMLREVLK
jgi:hypothetical protein